MNQFQGKPPMQRDNRLPAREITRLLQRLTVTVEQRAQQCTEDLCNYLEAFVAQFIVTIDRQVRDDIVVGGHSHAFDMATDEHFELALRPSDRFTEHQVQHQRQDNARWERVEIRRPPRNGLPEPTSRQKGRTCRPTSQ